MYTVSLNLSILKLRKIAVMFDHNCCCFQCVILTEVPLSVQLKVNSFCRAHDVKVITEA